MSLITVERLTNDDQPTIGLVRINGVPTCFSLEDRPREVKVAGDTRIPDGVYKAIWRKVGRFAKRWQGRGFPGSIQLLDVPGFDTILVHGGNTKKDTEGCLLMGFGADFTTRTIARSRLAVTEIYRKVAAGGDWEVEVK